MLRVVSDLNPIIAAALLGVTTRTLRDSPRYADIPYTRTTGGHRRYHSADITAWLDQHADDTPSGAARDVDDGDMPRELPRRKCA